MHTRVTDIFYSNSTEVYIEQGKYSSDNLYNIRYCINNLYLFILILYQHCIFTFIDDVPLFY